MKPVGRGSEGLHELPSTWLPMLSASMASLTAGQISQPKILVGSAVTDSAGAWSVTYPANYFSTAAFCIPVAAAVAAGAKDRPWATLQAQSKSGANGHAIKGATVTLTGDGVAIAASVVVNLVVIGW